MKAHRLIGTVVFLALLGTLSGAAIFAQDSYINNTRIIEMVKMGFDDEVIIAKIKTGRTGFVLGDENLVQLKNAGVSGKVIAAMLGSSVLTSPRVKVDGMSVDLHTLGQGKVGGRIGHIASLRWSSVKWKAYLPGVRSSVVAGSDPKIEIELPPGDTPDNYLVVQMDERDDRREVEVASGYGIWVGHKTGIRASKIVKTSYEPLGGRRFKIAFDSKLDNGEYIIYIVGSANYDHGVYGKGFDFSVF